VSISDRPDCLLPPKVSDPLLGAQNQLLWPRRFMPPDLGLVAGRFGFFSQLPVCAGGYTPFSITTISGPGHLITLLVQPKC